MNFISMQTVSMIHNGYGTEINVYAKSTYSNSFKVDQNFGQKFHVIMDFGETVRSPKLQRQAYGVNWAYLNFVFFTILNLIQILKMI